MTKLAILPLALSYQSIILTTHSVFARFAINFVAKKGQILIHVDIRTKIIRSDTKVYVIRPGAHYRLFDQFFNNKFIGIELPKLSLPSFEKLENVEDLNERILRSIAFRKWFIAGKPVAEYPDGDLLFYKDRGLDSAGRQFLRYVQAFFKDIQKGDIVVMPPRSFKKDAFLGEFVGAPNDVARFASPIYPEMLVDGRDVRWLSKIPKADLPAQTLDRLQRPSVVFLLEKSFWPKIFRTCYGSYSTNAEFSADFRITKETFQTADDFLIQAFFNFVIANTEKLTRGDTALLDFQSAAFADVRSFSPSLYTNVNSPGSIALKSALITPIVISTMLALAIYVGPEAVNSANSDTIAFGNSLSLDDDCTAGVKKQVVNQLKLLGYGKWSEACSKIREAAANTGIETGTTVTVNP